MKSRRLMNSSAQTEQCITLVNELVRQMYPATVEKQSAARSFRSSLFGPVPQGLAWTNRVGTLLYPPERAANSPLHNSLQTLAIGPLSS